MRFSRIYPYIIILSLLGLIPYSRTLDVPFTLDDVSCIEKNPFITDLNNYFDRLTIDKTFAASPGVFEDTRNSFITRPLSYLTFSINYFVHGYELSGYHAVNILIHLINIILVFLLVQRSYHLLESESDSSAEYSTSQHAIHIAFLTAALFAIHPLMTNAVTYIVQRMTSLVALFYLASILAYSYQASTGIMAKKFMWYSMSLIFCIGAMLTKESAFTLPIGLMIYEVVICCGKVRQRIVRLLPFFITMAIIPYNVMGLQNSAAAQTSGIVTNSLNIINFNHVSSWEYVLTQFRAVAFYLRLLFYPVGLSLEHYFPVSQSIAEIKVVFSLCIHLMIIGYGVYLIVCSKQSNKFSIIKKLTGFGVIWFYLTLAVESSVIPMNDMAVEYRTYLPSIGFFLFVTCQVHWILSSTGKKTSVLQEYYFWVPVLCILFSLTLMRNEIWRNQELFWTQTVSQYPKLGRPYTILAEYYIKRGELTKAAGMYSAAIQQMPGEAIFYYELGVVHIMSNDFDSAIPALVRALIIKPDMQKAYQHLAQIYLYLGQRELAVETIRQLESVRYGK